MQNTQILRSFCPCATGKTAIYGSERRNKPRTAEVGAISKAQNLQGDPSGFVKLQLVAKNFKKLKGGPFEEMKKFPKKKF